MPESVNYQMKDANKLEKTWIDFWKTGNVTSERILQLNMDIFIKSTDPILNYNNEDIVLDIGCGPGYLPAALTQRIKEIHSLDISERYLDICRNRLRQYKNVFFYKLDENNYTDLSVVKGKKFSKIICLSVIQYYKNSHEVEKLIKEVQGITLPGAKFLIADIPTNTTTYSDIWSILKMGFTEKCMYESIRNLIKHRISDYYQLRSKVGLLVFSKDRMNNLMQKHNLDAEILTTQMTINKSRMHLLIRF